MCKRILIKGAGEMASAVAHRLYKCGYQVIMTEIEKPTAVRRKVSFCSAIYEGAIEIEGVLGAGGPEGRGAGGPDLVNPHLLRDPDILAHKILVIIDPEDQSRTLFNPDVLIDGRLLKKENDTKITDAPLVIGLGPGFEAGKDVHYVVETNRGHNLGRIISQGCAAPDTGVPGNIGGYSTERVLRSSCDGVFYSEHDIGDLVKQGDVIGTVGDEKIKAQISGVLRGLIKSGLTVTRHQKIGDIDPRGDVSFCHAISDKARNISGSVLEIVMKA